MINRLIEKYRLKRAMSDRDKDPGLELAMTVDGHRVYKYRTIGNLPLAREVITRIGYAKLENGIRRDDLTVYTEMMDDLLNKQQFTKAAQLNGFLADQLNEFIPERIALEIGGYTVLVDDEPHETITDKHNAIKADLVSRHPAVRDFFLAESVGVMSALNSSIESSLMLGQLMNPNRAAKERIFLSMMGLDIFKGLWTVVTPPPSGWQKRVATLLLGKS